MKPAHPAHLDMRPSWDVELMKAKAKGDAQQAATAASKRARRHGQQPTHHTTRDNHS